MNPQPDLYLFVENNSTDETLRIIVNVFQRPKKIIRFWLQANVGMNGDFHCGIGTARQLALQYARNNDYDYLIFIDTDMQLKDPNLISRLAEGPTSRSPV